jgi:hypothetical protein
MAAAAATAAASDGSGTGSVRSWETRCAFKQIPAGAGRQGMNLSDLINYASTDINITGANWHMLGKQAVSSLARKLVYFCPHPDRVLRYSTSGRHNSSMR